MPLPRSTRDRVRQVLNWLRAEYPTRYPVVLTFRRLAEGEKGGECDLRRRRFHIAITPGLGWYESIELLFHEYAHALTWHYSAAPDQPDHPDEWSLAFGRLYRRFHDENGYMDSRDFPWT